MTEVIDELIELRGLRFHYRDWTSQQVNAPDLVLLHGYTGHCRSWDAFANVMSKQYRVLALDQRGHGETEWAPADQYGTMEMVADLDAFVSALRLERFVLLGLSMGGMVAIAYAGARPVQLARLVIVDIAPEIAAEGIQNIQQSVARSDVFDTVEDAFRRARADNPVPPEGHHYDRVRASLMRTDEGKWTYRYDRALRGPGSQRLRLAVDEGWDAVASFNVPTLLIRGEHSPLLSRDVADKFVSIAKNSQLVEVPGSGHPVPLDKPEGFLDAVQTFL
ncbi:MAG: alpha/beta hydrolase [Pseudomonadales bacterium]|nr:alpha/beta hydrolase [Pseudomonadales bacterium]